MYPTNYYGFSISDQMNYYTKRLTLAALYKSTELYMLQDSSPEQQDTWFFLNRRMEDLSKAGKCIKEVSWFKKTLTSDILVIKVKLSYELIEIKIWLFRKME